MQFESEIGRAGGVLWRPPSMRTSMRALLHEATGDLHRRLDAGLLPLFGQGESGYRLFLACTARALLPLEEALEASGVVRTVPDWQRRSRRAVILEDLARRQPSWPP